MAALYEAVQRQSWVIFVGLMFLVLKDLAKPKA